MANAPSRIFISYSHRGNGPRWKEALLRALHVFERHHLLDVWQDGKIRVSSFWDDDIAQAVATARLAVVLLTPEALASQYILEKEFPLLLQRQHQDKLPVFPVVCEDCDWRAHDWLRATQAPNESNPLAQLSTAAQERVFRQLATNIAEELSRVALAELLQPDQPLSSDRVYLESVPLTRNTGMREEILIGREQELALLDLAFAQPRTAIVSLVAWGGVGKTMLVQHWLRRLEQNGWFGARRVYAWSFFSQGTKEDRQASEDSFLAHALAWFGVDCEPTLSPWDKGRLLAEAVVRERTLLILDGIEPLQYPPGPMGGQLRAPGVQSLLKYVARAAGDSEDRGLCLVTTREPMVDLADFGRHQGSGWGSVLRVDLGNLTHEAGAALLHHAGAKRAGAAEIPADDAELLAAGGEVDGHALTLNLLGRFLARAHGGDIRRRDLVKFEEADRNEQGGTTFKMLAAFESWFARSGEFGARQLAVLRMLGLFDRPADSRCIAALRKPPIIAGLTDPLFTMRPEVGAGQAKVEPILDEDWNTAISFLADFGLAKTDTYGPIPVRGFDQAEVMARLRAVERGYDHPLGDPQECMQEESPGSNTGVVLDVHPLVREYFRSRLCDASPKAYQSGHSRLFEHLAASVPYWPEGVEGLGPLYQALQHGCNAGLHEEARTRVYCDRILRGTTEPDGFYASRKLGIVGDDLAALACFFEKPWTCVSPKLTTAARNWLLGEAGFNLRALARLTEAQEATQAGLEGMVEGRFWKNAAVLAMTLSDLKMTLGDVQSAIRDAQRASELADQSGKVFERLTNIARLANALCQAGEQSAALGWFRKAEVMQASRQPTHPLLYSLQGFLYCQALLGNAESAAWRSIMGASDSIHRSSALGQQDDDALTRCSEVAVRARKTLRWEENENWLFDIALDHLTIGRAKLYQALLVSPAPNIDGSSLASASQHLNAAVDGLRRAAQQDYIPPGLLARSWLRSLSKDPKGAHTDLDEAWDIAERGPMRLHMTDIHLHRAWLFFREQQYPWKSPEDDLAAAEKLINECGYHRRDDELADAKRAILGD